MNKSEFVRKMESARNAFIKAEEKEHHIFDELGKQFPIIDLDNCTTDAENANSIQEAITCYLQYGEYTPENIWDEIIMANMAQS